MVINHTNPVISKGNIAFSAYGRSPGSDNLAQTLSGPDSSQVNENNDKNTNLSGNLNEIQSQIRNVDSVSSGGSQLAVLKEDSGSRNIYAGIAASIYVLNHSFDEQKGILDLIV